MDRPLRIAAVGPLGDALLAELRHLPTRPDVRVFRDLVTDGDGLARLQPDVLVLALALAEPDAGESIGALRLLQQLWPSLGTVVVTDAAHELALAPVAKRLKARLVVHPDRPGQLAAAIEQALLGSDRPRADAFVDLAHGIADEINNPLQFVSGHLQLLRASLQTAEARDQRDQLASAMAGLVRIQATVERLRLLAQAANGPRPSARVDLRELAAEATAHSATAARAAAPARATVALADRELPVLGDRRQLAAALAALVAVADQFAAAGTTTQLTIAAVPGAVRLRCTSTGPALRDWSLPHSFEPYYPARALRGQAPGLGLFIAQTVVLGHGGQARAQRQADGSLQFDFLLPLAP
jgi:signal transduction histidine kinase